MDEIRVEKYRPENLSQIASHESILETIRRFIISNNLPHLLFYGPPGTGKTTAILAIAREIYGSAAYRSMILELNASDDRGIDVIRDQIKSFASTKMLSFSNDSSSSVSAAKASFKLIILDEADSMTSAAQAALRRVIEKYVSNVRFCIICNFISKITPALQSRCTKFRFAPVPISAMRPRLKEIVEFEKVQMSEDALEALLKLSQGDFRRALNILQSARSAYDFINEDKLYSVTGSPSPNDTKLICQALLNEDFSSALSAIKAIKVSQGLSLADIIHEVFEFLSRYEIPLNWRVYLTIKMAEIEHNLSVGSNESVQLSSLVGAFSICRNIPNE